MSGLKCKLGGCFCLVFMVFKEINFVIKMQIGGAFANMNCDFHDF